MLLQVGVPSSTVSELTDVAEARLFLTVLADWGLPVLAPDDLAAVLTELRKLPATVQQMLEALLETRVAIATSGTSCRCVSRPAELTAVERHIAAGSCTSCSGLVVPWDAVDACAQLASIKRTQRSPIPSGADRDVEFDKRIRPVITGASRVYLLDRYAGSRLQPDGDMAWLLRRLQDVGTFELVVLTARRHTVRSDLSAIRSAWPNRLGLWMAPDNRFKAGGHDRAIGAVFRTGYPRAISLGKGLASFSDSSAGGPYTTQYLEGADGLPAMLDDVKWDSDEVDWI